MSKKKFIEQWNENFRQIGLNATIVSSYNIYVEKLIRNGAPVIFDINHLAKLLGRSPRFISAIINSSKNFYRQFEIPKRSGGKRIISAPYPSLMECQVWVYQNILLNQTVHKAAQAYTFKRSIITNAKVHLEATNFLKIDIKDFFPSITQSFVVQYFKELGYSHQIAFYLSSICCTNGSLPQGAPTSPMLSNLIFRSVDNRLDKLAVKFNYKYSRYADDMVFSGSKISVKFIDYVSHILNNCGFTVNKEKTYITNHCSKKIITGISVTNHVLKVPSNYSKALKQELFFIQKFGILSHMSKLKIKNPSYPYSVLGRLQFWQSVEPENSFVRDAIKKLNDTIEKSGLRS